MKRNVLAGGRVYIQNARNAVGVGHGNPESCRTSVSVSGNIQVVFDIARPNYPFIIGAIAAVHCFANKIAPTNGKRVAIGIDTTGFCPGNNGRFNGKWPDLANVNFSGAVVGGPQKSRCCEESQQQKEQKEQIVQILQALMLQSPQKILRCVG